MSTATRIIQTELGTHAVSETASILVLLMNDEHRLRLYERDGIAIVSHPTGIEYVDYDAARMLVAGRAVQEVTPGVFAIDLDLLTTKVVLHGAFPDDVEPAELTVEELPDRFDGRDYNDQEGWR